MKGVHRSVSWNNEADGVPALLEVVLQPVPQSFVETIGLFGQHEERKPFVPLVGVLSLVEVTPGIGHPALGQCDHPERFRNFLRTGDYVSHFLRELREVRAVREQPVVTGGGHHLCLGVLFLLEHEPAAILVDVETVLDDRRHLSLEFVVVNQLALRGLHLQDGRFGPCEVPDRDGAQPQCRNDLLQVRQL